MTTRVDDVMLMAYVDGEVDAATARQIERAMAADDAVAARVRLFRNSAAALRSAFADAMHEKVPDRLVEAANADARGPGKVVALAGRRPPRQIIGWAVAASLAAFAVGGGTTYWYTTAGPGAEQGLQAALSERWLDNVAGYYDVYDGALRKDDRQLVDLKADDIPELAAWLNARLNRKINLPDLSGLGFQPQGGRLVVISGKPGAQLVYVSESGELVGLIIATTTAPPQKVRTERRGGTNIVYWRNGGYAYAFVSTIDPQRLGRLAEKAWKDLDRI